MNSQHFFYIFFVIIFNFLLITMGVASPVGILNMIVVGLTHFRDTMFVLIRIFFKPCVKQSVTDEDLEKRKLRNILCVIPTYKEEAKEVTQTLESLINQEENEVVNKRIVMVCDGFFRYEEIFSSMILIETFQYRTFKQKLNRVNVYYCTYNDYDLIVMLKYENAGKKDSLILIDSIFIENSFLNVRHALLKFCNITAFHYIFHTDADSVVSANTLRRASKIMESNTQISAVTGIVLVAQRYGFWSLFQGFQYYYGQLIRRLTESYWGKPTCMPGCTNMVNISHDCIIEASTRYQKLPSTKYLFQVKNRLQGTDRRYTNCVLQYSKHVRLVTDPKSLCYTIPPQSLSHFRSQRKRWTSNAITGYFFLLFGSNIPWFVRVLAVVDLFRIHTCLTRLVSTVMFLIHINQVTIWQFGLMALVFGIPYVFFFVHAVKMKKYGLFLICGSILSKFVSPIITVYIFSYCLYHFEDLSWGKTHGALGCDGQKELAESTEIVKCTDTLV